MNEKRKSNKDEPKNLTEEEILGLIEREVNKKFSLSIKYWYPTLISVALGAIALVWWFHGIITPIETAITDLQRTQQTNTPHSAEVVKWYFLEGIDPDKLTSEQELTIKDVAYELKQRKDLVAIIAGYTNNDKIKDQNIRLQESEVLAGRVKKYLLSDAITEERLFSKGYGFKVPPNFPKKQDKNVCIMLCDIFVLMQNATY